MALPRIVDDDGEVIARRHVLAQDDCIAPLLGPRVQDLRPAILAELGEGEPLPAQPLTRQVARPLHVEAQRKALAVVHAPVDLRPRHPLVQAGIERRPVGIERARHRRRLDLAARGKARVEHALRLQPLRGVRVVGKVLRLAQHRRLPIEPEPGEILEDAGDVFLAAASDVDILDAHEEAAAQRAAPCRTPPAPTAHGQGAAARWGSAQIEEPEQS